MTIILCLLAVIAVCYVIASRSYSGVADLCTIVAIFTGMLLTFALLFIPLNRMKVRSNIAAFNAVRDSRAGGQEIEAAAWRMKVAEQNAWLASKRYYNRTLFDLWIPDEIEALQPIE